MSGIEQHHVKRFADAVFQALQKMDAEAVPGERGLTGLNWYGGHARPDLKRPQTEPSWSRRLAELLPDSGLPARAEVCYPRHTGVQGGFCDVVATLPNKTDLWLEIKGSWPLYWGRKNGVYRSYLFHPLLPGLGDKSHTVPLDIEKLRVLRHEDASHCGLLLLGFDSDGDPMDADVAELVQLAGLVQPPWATCTRSWKAVNRPGENVKCWMWVRAVR